MSLHNRRLKVITLDLDGTNFECQVKSWTLNNNTDDGDKIYTYCPSGESIEEVDPDYSLSLTFYSDWTADGVSDFLWANDGEDITFQLDHHPDIVGEHVRWTGTLRVKAPNVGGDRGDTEETEVELQIIGTPVYSRP